MEILTFMYQEVTVQPSPISALVKDTDLVQYIRENSIVLTEQVMCINTTQVLGQQYTALSMAAHILRYITTNYIIKEVDIFINIRIQGLLGIPSPQTDRR